MGSLVWLGLVVVLVAVVALTGRSVKGAKPVARTGLMKAARAVLIIGIIICGVMGVSGAFRH